MEICLRIVATLAAARAALGLVLCARGLILEPRSDYLWVYLLQIGVYLAAGIFLIAGSRHDRRGICLAAAFCVVASSFAYAPLSDPAWSASIPAGIFLKALAWLNPEPFLPLLVWLFVRDFPRRPAGQQPERILVLATTASWFAGVSLFLVNLLLPMMGDAPVLLKAFDGRAITSFYWAVLFGLILPAFPYALLQSRSTTRAEKRRVRLFIAALTLAAVPVSLYIVFASLFPNYWRHERNSLANRIALGLSQALVLSVPLTTSYSVIVDKVLDVKLIVRKVIQYALARYTIITATALPFAAGVLFLYLHREDSIAGLLSGSRPFALAAVLISGAALLTVRERIMTVIDKGFFREQYDAHSILAGLIAAARHAEGCEALAQTVAAQVDSALHLESIALFTLDNPSGAYQSPDRRLAPLRKSAVLCSLIGGNAEPLDVDIGKPRSALTRLPEEERQWLSGGAFRLLVPVIGSRRDLIGFMGLGEKKSDLPFSKEDRRLLSEVASSAALALENRFLYATPSGTATGPIVSAPQSRASGSDEDSFANECARCRLVQPPAETVCRDCGDPMVTAMVPHSLAGKFRFLRRIGSGGMGIVYLAADVELGRKVAVKILPSISPELAARFRREARAMAAVMHQNLALIFGVEYWRATPMLVIEYLEGGTLADRIRQKRFSPLEAADLGIALADALERIHSASILHRDIKPSNIAYTADGTPKLLDFGLARMLDTIRSAGAADSTVAPDEVATATHVTHGLVGTLAYLPPEAFRGRPAGVQTDLWALGLVLFEAIAGRNPFQQGSAAETVLCIQRGIVPEIGGFVPSCPEALSGFFRGVLAGNDEERPADAREFGRRVRELRVGLELPLRREGLEGRQA